MMKILKSEEDKTDLENLAVLSRVGMKVASASSSELDADATSASSTALIDLGLRLSVATAHGDLTEIILHNTSGYSIILAINDEYLVFGGLKNVYRIGYYLGYIRELAKKLNLLISGDEITDMTLSLDDSEKAKLNIEEETVTSIKKPSIEEDKAALDDLLGFLDDWEKEGNDLEDIETEVENKIVTIPKSVGLEYEKQLEKSVEGSEPSIKSEEPSQVLLFRLKIIHQWRSRKMKAYRSLKSSRDNLYQRLFLRLKTYLLQILMLILKKQLPSMIQNLYLIRNPKLLNPS
jgi:predicted regulator of Ras-like GTPase activity (Roadblock/LC7/MglB family)